MAKEKPATWSQIKQRLNGLDQKALLDLVRDLYQLNADNKIFLTTRFNQAVGEALTEPYRAAIRREFNPDRGFPRINLSSARKAVNDFKKASQDPRAVIDLMLYYVEQGVICTNNYGDIDAPFYSSLESVCAEAANLLHKQNDQGLLEDFYPRFRKIVGDTSGIGWGFHDALADIFDSLYGR